MTHVFYRLGQNIGPCKRVTYLCLMCVYISSIYLYKYIEENGLESLTFFHVEDLSEIYV
jgi:hypothetical protein